MSSGTSQISLNLGPILMVTSGPVDPVFMAFGQGPVDLLMAKSGPVDPASLQPGTWIHAVDSQMPESMIVIDSQILTIGISGICLHVVYFSAY